MMKQMALNETWQMIKCRNRMNYEMNGSMMSHSKYQKCLKMDLRLVEPDITKVFYGKTSIVSCSVFLK